MPQTDTPVIIVGAGWAGLAAAVELSRYKIPVTVLESAKQIGGRARRIPFHNSAAPAEHNAAVSAVDPAEPVTPTSSTAISVDNGQHLLVGAYESTLSLLRIIDVKEASVFKRVNLSLTLLNQTKNAVNIKTPNLPAPLHLIWGLATARGLSLKERFSALQFYRRLAQQDFTLPEDESCATLFSRHSQPHNVIKTLWKPLCLWGLNTPIEQASAEIFLRMLRETFAHTRQDSNLLLAYQDLSAVFPDPAMDFIERQAGSIQLGQKLQEFYVNHQSLTGLTLHDRSIKARHVILATPFHVTAKLCQANSHTTDLGNTLAQLQSNPLCTVYLQFPRTTTLNDDMVGMVDTVSQWVFDRKIYGQQGLMAVVINGSGRHLNLSNAQMIETVKTELAHHFPHWPQPQQAMVVREKRATFNCSVNVNTIRPPNKTSVRGLWIAGDYTNTGLPATLEGAVRSGVRAARGVMADLDED